MNDVETETNVVTHWGVELLRIDGSVYITRWNPGYGSGYGRPYTEDEARADATRSETGFPASRKRLVKRTETTTIATAPWEPVEDEVITFEPGDTVRHRATGYVFSVGEGGYYSHQTGWWMNTAETFTSEFYDKVEL